MKDIIGQPISEGDLVAYTHSGTTQMFPAKIVGFTAKMVKICDLRYADTDSNYDHSQNKSPDRVLKITGQYKEFLDEYPELFV